jgi:FkbM family methyltransferase
VLAFEPSGSTYSRLLENIELNKITNVKIFNIGLADQDSVLELNISKNGYEAWNTFVQSDDQKFSEKEKVSVKSFDHFIEENLIDTDRITLIKLDVEGFELKVLKGATQLLSKENAPVLIVEYSDALSLAAGHCCHEIYKYLEGFGYTWYSYISIEKKLVYDPMRINYPYVNLIAIKNPDKIEGLKKFTIQMKPRKI